MLYLSKPRGKYGVVISRYDQGAYDVVRVVPGTNPRDARVVGGRDFLAKAKELADQMDQEDV